MPATYEWRPGLPSPLPSVWQHTNFSERTRHARSRRGEVVVYDEEHGQVYWCHEDWHQAHSFPMAPGLGTVSTEEYRQAKAEAAEREEIRHHPWP